MEVFIIYNEQGSIRGVFTTFENAKVSCCHTFNDNDLVFLKTQSAKDIWSVVGKELFIQKFTVSDEWHFL